MTKHDPGMEKRVEITAAEFAGFQQLIYREAGILYPEAKRNLLLARIERRMKHLRLERYGEYLALISGGRKPDELAAFLNVITTNETFFFRCQRHWDFFHSWLQERASAKPAPGEPRRLRIWSAASSNGSELYTVAMMIVETLGFDAKGMRLELLGTDLNDDVLAEAKLGRFHAHALRQVPKEKLERWFKPLPDGSQQIDPRLVAMVKFRHHNLLERISGTFDLIFLRNVMIYFDTASRTKVLKNIAEALVPGGTLIIGESESLIGVDHPFRYVKPSVFAKAGGPVPAGTRG